MIAACVAYATSFNGVFVFDDKYAILDNPHIKTLWPLTAAMSAPPENPVSGRPVASLTLAINYALADAAVRDAMLPGRPGDPPEATERFLANVWGYHALNLALHVLAGLALFGVVRRTLLSERLRPQFEDAATPLACAAALVWLVHPLTTDAVTYVCQRTEVLMGLFCLLTVYCSIRAAESPRRRAAWGAAAIAACALGMGSKQTMIVAPVLVWLWDWTFAAQPAGEASAGPRPPRWPLYAGLAATWSIVAASVALERWPHSIGLDRDGWTPWRYLLTQTGVITHYLRLVILPWPLALDYDGWPAAHGLGDVWAPALALAALFAVTVYGVLKRRPWSVATAAVFLLLAPSSSVLPLPTEIAAERRMYVPLAAIVALAVVAAFVVIRRLFVAVPRRRLALVVAVLVAGVVAGPLVFVTRARNRDFWSDSGIWGDTVAKRPDNPRARQSYGIALMRERRLPEAETELREAVRLRDTSAPAHGSLGVLLCMTGRTDDGIAHLERALALDPEYTDAFRNLGEAYASQGKR